MPIGKSSSNMGSKDLPIGKLDDTVTIIGIPKFLQIMIDSGLAKCDDPVDLLLRVNQTLFNVEEVAGNVNLRRRSAIKVNGWPREAYVVNAHVDKNTARHG